MAFESYQIADQLLCEVEKNPELDYTYYPKHSEIYKEKNAKKQELDLLDY
jgi:hypothetical protein